MKTWTWSRLVLLAVGLLGAVACEEAPPVPPEIVETTQSPTDEAGISFTLRVVARDPRGSDLFFNWTSELGTLGSRRNTETTSEVHWTAPRCGPEGLAPTVTVTVLNMEGLSTSATFTLPPLHCSKPISVAAGHHYSLVVYDDGTVWGWGLNNDGVLGELGGPSQSGPIVKLRALTGVKAVRTEAQFAIALREDGTVWGWGRDVHQLLGDEVGALRLAPVRMSNFSDVKQVVLMWPTLLMLREDGTVWARGQQLVTDGAAPDRWTPVRVSGLGPVKALASDGGHALALLEDGTVWAWGENYSGQLGDGTTTSRSTPVQVSGLSGVKAVAAGGGSSLALREDGTVWSWGGNFTGQLGDGTTTHRSTPAQVSGLGDVKEITASNRHVLVVRQDGTVWGWGENDYNALADGTTTARLTPVRVAGSFDRVTSVSLRNVSSHLLLLRDDGTVWGWGSNKEGQLLPCGTAEIITYPAQCVVP